MIEIRNLSHSLGGKLVLREINLEIPDNTVLGIVGINGAGKSTLLRLLSGVYLPDEGSIAYDGRSPSEAETRKDIFFLPDDPYYTATSTPNKMFDFYKTFYHNLLHKLKLEIHSENIAHNHFFSNGTNIPSLNSTARLARSAIKWL